MAVRNELDGMATNLSNIDVTDASLNNIQNWTQAKAPFPTEMHSKGEIEQSQKHTFFGGFLSGFFRGGLKASHVSASSIPSDAQKQPEVASQVGASDLDIDSQKEKRGR